MNIKKLILFISISLYATQATPMGQQLCAVTQPYITHFSSLAKNFVPCMAKVTGKIHDFIHMHKVASVIAVATGLFMAHIKLSNTAKPLIQYLSNCTCRIIGILQQKSKSCNSESSAKPSHNNASNASFSVTTQEAKTADKANHLGATQSSSIAATYNSPKVAHGRPERNSPDTCGNMDLLLAARNGRVKDVNDLIQGGADPNSTGKNGITPLHVAASRGKIPVIEALITNGANINMPDYDKATPLHHAAATNHAKTVTALLRLGANPNLKDLIGYTPLHCAAENNYTEIVQTLIANNACADTENEDSRTALDLAVQSENTDINLVRILVDHTKSQKQKQAALTWAQKYGKREIIDYLQPFLS